jgi:hypothetical protein
MRPPLRSERDPPKRAAAARAVTEVEDGMVLSDWASGSTAAFAVEALAARIAKGLRVAGIGLREAGALGAAPRRAAHELRRASCRISSTRRSTVPIRRCRRGPGGGDRRDAEAPLSRRVRVPVITRVIPSL